MDVNFINPFVESTLNVISTMAMIECKPGKPGLKKGKDPLGDVTGVIGMAGEKVTGSMAIIFPSACATRIVSSMLGEEFTEVNDDVLDCVGELTNMISGGAKAKLGEMGYKFEMATPSMITGVGHSVYHKTSGPIIVLPFQIAEGDFYLEACFTSNGG